MAERGGGPATFTTSIVRVALLVRLLSLLVVLVLPIDVLDNPRVVVAVAVVAAWSLLWLVPGGAALRYVEQHPIVAVGDVLLAAAVTGLVGVDSPLVFVTLSTALIAGVLLPPLAAWLVTGVLVLSYLLAVLPGAAGDAGDAGGFVPLLALPATFVVLASLGRVTRSLYDRLLVEQERVLEAQVSAARSAERARLARTMHDSVAKSLHGIALAAAALPRWVDQDGRTAAVQARAVQQAAEQAAAEAREMLVSLRAVAAERPFVQRLADLVDGFGARTGVEVDLRTEGLVDLEDATADEVVHLVGEALENVARHAGASRVLVTVQPEDDGQVVVSVDDDGRGFDPEAGSPGRFGVLGMRERAEQVGGTLEVRSEPGSGTRVAVRLPFPAGVAR